MRRNRTRHPETFASGARVVFVRDDDGLRGLTGTVLHGDRTGAEVELTGPCPMFVWRRNSALAATTR